MKAMSNDTNTSLTVNQRVEASPDTLEAPDGTRRGTIIKVDETRPFGLHYLVRFGDHDFLWCSASELTAC